MYFLASNMSKLQEFILSTTTVSKRFKFEAKSGLINLTVSERFKVEAKAGLINCIFLITP